MVTGVVPSPPRFLPSIFIAHRVQQSHCSSIFHRGLLTHALALSASQFVHEKKSPRIYPSIHSGGFELTKLTYTGYWIYILLPVLTNGAVVATGGSTSIFLCPRYSQYHRVHHIVGRTNNMLGTATNSAGIRAVHNDQKNARNLDKKKRDIIANRDVCQESGL